MTEAAAWDREYASGRYRGEAPVEFVRDIVAAATAIGARHGVYVGCGNGRNLVPLWNAGLDLIGLDISAGAIGQLRKARPDRADRLLVGDLTALPAGARYPLLIGIQVFQHGDRTRAHDTLTAAAGLVAPGGLLCVRVNATDTDIEHDHERYEDADGFTVSYLAGPKTGLDIHFFTADELRMAVGEEFGEVLPLRVHSTRRPPPGRGQWSQWEGIWRRRG